jgi:hypothetical protein
MLSLGLALQLLDSLKKIQAFRVPSFNASNLAWANPGRASRA